MPDTVVTLPKGSESYVAYQRTSYLFPWLEGLFRIVGLLDLYSRVVTPRLSRIFRSRIARRYSNDLQNDYEDIQKVIPAHSQNILDIGCGIAGIDAYIFRGAADPKPAMWLLDKDGVSDLYYGFESDASFYNSLEKAREFLIANGVPDQNIRTVNILTESFPETVEFDVVISLISWGFHYPVSTYLEQVHKALSPTGVLIIDVRKETDGEDELRAMFGAVNCIKDYDKHKRLVCTK